MTLCDADGKLDVTAFEVTCWRPPSHLHPRARVRPARFIQATVRRSLASVARPQTIMCDEVERYMRAR